MRTKLPVFFGAFALCVSGLVGCGEPTGDVQTALGEGDWETVHRLEVSGEDPGSLYRAAVAADLIDDVNEAERLYLEAWRQAEATYGVGHPLTENYSGHYQIFMKTKNRAIARNNASGV